MKAHEGQPVVSVVVVTWNGKQYAMECLKSLLALESKLDLQVVVVDNASTDGTPDAIREQFPRVELVQNPNNLGFAKANNMGISRSNGRYVCLVNSDVVVTQRCFEKMIAFMDANPGIGLLGPKMLSPDGGIGPSVMRLPTVGNSLCCALGLHSVFRRSDVFGGYLIPNFPYNAIADVEVLTGWFWMVRRSALAQVGDLDERFFMYGEDIDWCHRFLKAGWRVVFYPEAEALHYGAASSSQAPARFYVEMRRANLQYFKKHYGRLRTAGYVLTTWVHELVRLLAYGAVYCVRGTQRSAAASKVERSWSCIRWLTRSGSPVAYR